MQQGEPFSIGGPLQDGPQLVTRQLESFPWVLTRIKRRVETVVVLLSR